MTEAAGRSPVAVIGLGNRMRSDDGLGPAVVDGLADVTDDRVELVVLDGDPTRLLATWDRRALAVVVDAVVSGARPGTVHRVEGVPSRLESHRRSASSHAAGVAEAVDLGRVLGRMPERLVVFGVEVASLALGPELSPEVMAAVPDVVDRIRQAVAGELAGSRSR